MAIDRESGLRSLRGRLKDGSMLRLSDRRPIDVVPTGVATLDAALGVGGLVRGSQNILWGSASSGKSALAYVAIGSLMRRDPQATACVFDIERSCDPDWMARFGVDPDRVTVVQQPTIEDNVNSFQEVMLASAFDYILVDSLGAVVRSVDFDGRDGKGGDASKAQVGGSSGVITRWVNKANSELIVLDKMEAAGEEVLKPVILYINQVRADLKSMYGGQTMSGGYALRHMANVIMRISASNAAADRITGTVGREKVQVGTHVTVTVEKNKYAAPKHQAGYDFVWEECPEREFGIDSVAACLDLALDRGVVRSKGAWLYWGEEGQDGFVKANGRSQMVELMRDNEGLYDDVYAAVMACGGCDDAQGA